MVQPGAQDFPIHSLLDRFHSGGYNLQLWWIVVIDIVWVLHDDHQGGDKLAQAAHCNLQFTISNFEF